MYYHTLTPYQKMEAMSLKYYSGCEWKPSVGDYYTTAHNDLELYQIVREDATYFYTINCNRDNARAVWKITEFLNAGFERRVHIPIHILENM